MRSHNYAAPEEREDWFSLEGQDKACRIKESVTVRVSAGGMDANNRLAG